MKEKKITEEQRKLKTEGRTCEKVRYILIIEKKVKSKEEASFIQPDLIYKGKNFNKTKANFY